MEEHFQHLYQALSQVDGYIYPNEIDLHWGLMIVLYPYITGLVAGAFILASLERVFHVKVLKPTYGIALLTALAFLAVATMPLVSHLQHPLRSYEIFMTPNSTSAMAIFGFVYLWYLMAVLLLEIWFDYRRDFVIWSKTSTGFKKIFYKLITLGINDTDEKSAKLDDRLGYFITVVGIPSAFLLHGYVGFIFGSIKANPWWSTVLMPIIFLFSAMVSGVALVMLIYMVVSWIRKVEIDMKCLDTIAKYLFYILLIDFVLESLDQIHRIYEAEESFDIIKVLVNGKLYITLVLMQWGIGTWIPLSVIGLFQFYKPSEKIKKAAYFIVGIFVLVGIFFMRWNIVIGGQLFSKSLSGFTTFTAVYSGMEGYLMAAVWLIIPLFILAFLLWLMPPWKKISYQE